MDFSFTSDQRMLRDSVRKALADMPRSRIREGGRDPGVAAQAWQQASALGWPALMVPERAGGLGLGPVEATVIAEEMGRTLYPASYRDSAVLLPALLARVPEGQAAPLLQALCEGRIHLALAMQEEGADWLETSGCRIDGGRLHGSKTLVEHGPAATHFLVALRRPAGFALAVVAAADTGVQLTERPGLDITSGLADVDFDGAQVLLHATFDGEEMPDLFDTARLFNCAEMLGVADEALAMTLAYARERKQFGQSIGSFQAIKHRLADAFVQLENARSATYYAAIALQDQLPDAAFALDAAQAACADMAVRVPSDCIQVHGGIGFTWEYDLHLYFKRGRRLAAFLGGRPYACRRIAEALV